MFVDKLTAQGYRLVATLGDIPTAVRFDSAHDWPAHLLEQIIQAVEI
jgi:hypothetical protein